MRSQSSVLVIVHNHIFMSAHHPAFAVFSENYTAHFIYVSFQRVLSCLLLFWHDYTLGGRFQQTAGGVTLNDISNVPLV